MPEVNVQSLKPSELAPVGPARYARMSAYYFLFYTTVGVFSPYYSLFLRSHGLNDTQIGRVLAVIPAVGMLVQPLWGVLNDRYHVPKRSLFVGMLMGPLAAYLLLPNLHSVWAFAFATGVMAIFQTSLIPLSDSMTVYNTGIRLYGKIRMFGSLGYAMAANAAALVYQYFGIHWLIPSYLVATALALFGLAGYPSTPWLGRREVRGVHRLSSVLRNSQFVQILVLSFLMSVTQWMNSNFFSLYYVDLGRPQSWLGLIYALGAMSELPLFFLSGRLIQKIGPLRVLWLSTAVFAFRWAVFCLHPPTVVMVLLQLLHGASFGLALAAGISLAARVSNESNRVTSQMVYSATNTGIAAIIGSLVGGTIFDKAGGSVLYAVAFATCFVSLGGFTWMVKRGGDVF
jgi:PPP family 3-phenylpropionic acid transporter